MHRKKALARALLGSQIISRQYEGEGFATATAAGRAVVGQSAAAAAGCAVGGRSRPRTSASSVVSAAGSISETTETEDVEQRPSAPQVVLNRNDVTELADEIADTDAHDSLVRRLAFVVSVTDGCCDA